MKRKDLKRYSRAELIDLIYQMKKNEVELQRQLDEANEKLADRTILLSKSGSIAEASLSINGVFEAAQKAADDYLHSIQQASVMMENRMKKTDELCKKMLQMAQKQAQEIVDNAKR